jgi:hypothetical protein
MRAPAAMLLALGLLLLGGCGDTLRTTPELTLRPLPQAPPKSPILGLAVVDLEGAQRDPGYATRFAGFIRDTYGDAVQIVPSKTPLAGRANIIIRIIWLGSYKDRRHDTNTIADQFLRPSGNLADWAPVVAATASSGAVLSGQVRVLRKTGQVVPGAWSGVAYLEVEVNDLRRAGGAAFRLPLYAERVDTSNLSALSLADDAWHETNLRLAAFLDAAMQKLMRERAPPPPSARK